MAAGFISNENGELICVACGKVCYSKREAGRIKNLYHNGARHNRKGRKGDNVPQRVYFCKDCGTYHLTHKKYIRSKDMIFKMKEVE